MRGTAASSSSLTYPGRVIPGEEGPVVAGGFPAGVMAGAIPGELTTDDVAAIVAYLESL
ncbi:MAG: hypothetical protein ACRDY7_12790 [Acidimicrobiia bacterium]